MGEIWSHKAKMTSMWNQNFMRVHAPALELIWTWCHHTSKLHRKRLRLPIYRLLLDAGWQKHSSVGRVDCYLYPFLLNSATASSGAESDQGWAFQKSFPTHLTDPLPLCWSQIFTLTVSISILPSYEHAEERQKPISCNQTVCSAPVMQRTPSEKLQNITSQTLIHYSDGIMKLVLPRSFYCFLWLTN